MQPSTATTQQEVRADSVISQAPEHEQKVLLSPELSQVEIKRAEGAIESGPDHLKGVAFVGGDIHEFIQAHIHATGNAEREHEIATWVDYEIAMVAGVHTMALAESHIQSPLVDVFKKKIIDASHAADEALRESVMAAIDLERYQAAHPDTPVTIESIKALIPKQVIDSATKECIRALAIACSKHAGPAAH